MDQSQKSLISPKSRISSQPSKLKYGLIFQNCLDMAVASLMYHCKYINEFVLLLRKSAVGA